MSPPTTAPPAEWLHHLADEADAAYLYRAMAEAEAASDRVRVYRQLADVEDRHVTMWQALMAEQGYTVPRPKPSLRARTLVGLSRRFGSGFLLPMLLEEEGREVRGYLNLYKEAPEGEAAPTALLLARESKAHAERLASLTGGGAEPWHRKGAGGLLRNVVYGFNDGLTANFGLLAGMVGAQGMGSSVSGTVVIAGLAGMVADALSMGSSGYLAAKSEREVHEYEIAMEREEIRLMPELEEEELRLIYQAKGIPEEEATAFAAAVMSDPERALEEKVREELNIGEPVESPLREGWITGLATAVGAFIPVAPLLVSTHGWAIWTSFSLAMVSHFGVGAARTLFTGRGVLRSGFDMLVVGLGVAAVGYLVGDWMVKLL